MKRLTDFSVCFSMALFLHGLLIVGTAWLWNLRPPELRPLFQSGDVSLAVTIVAKDPDGRQITDENEPAQEAETGQNQDRLDPETATQELVKTPANPPAASAPNVSQAAQPDEALNQGVVGAVRGKSEIRPYYPLGARLRGEEGAVTIRVWVKPSGRANRCEVVRSSGFPMLDQAAMDAVRQAHYVSTQPGTWRAEVETVLTFRFKLTE